MSEKQQEEEKPAPDDSAVRKEQDFTAGKPSASDAKGKSSTRRGQGKSEAKSDSEPEPAKRGGRPGRGLAVTALVFALIAVLGAGTIGAGLYYLWQMQQQQTAAFADAQQARQTLDEDFAGLQSTLQELRSGLESAQRSAENAQRNAEESEQRQTALEQNLQRLREQIGTEQAGWVLAEVEYLLRVANQRLQLARDVQSTIAALQAADQRLRQLGDPAYFDVRQAIAKELQALQAVPRPDIDGLAAHLSSLAESTDALALADAYTGGDLEPATPGDGNTDEISGWREFVAALWADLKSLVSIRREGAEAVPMLPPEQRYFLRQNLRLKLESARTALLAPQPELYRQSLEDAGAWLRQYFQADTPAVSSMLSDIDKLKGRTIKPELPQINESLRQLLKVRQQRSGAGEGGTQ